MRGNGYFLNLSNDTIYEKFSSLMRGVYTALPYYHGGYHFDEHTNLWIIGNYDYFKVSDLEILKILHMHGLYSFTVINSIESAGIYNIERNLSLKKFQDSLKKAKNREVVFFVPNIFKIDHSFNLTAALASLINNGNAASEKPKLLFFHRAQYRIEPLLLGAIGNPVTTEMLDRLYDKKFKPASSFIYLISDEKTGAILFMGRKTD